jgi:hypothetical protein
MGDYNEEVLVELDPLHVPFELKAGTSMFPLLTDGILLDDDQRAVPLVTNGLDQTRIALELRSDTSTVALKNFCTHHGVTFLSVLNVTWSLVLGAYADIDVVNVLFVRYSAGVPHVGLSETAVEGGRTVQQTLADAEEQLSTSVAVPSATSVSDLQNSTAVNGRPVFNSVVLFSGSDTPERAEVRPT